MYSPRASASTSSGWAYSRSIRSRTRRSRARSLRRCAATGLLDTTRSCHAARELQHGADGLVAALLDDVGGAELARQPLAVRMAAERDDAIGAEPLRREDPGEAHHAV